ncbi:MAG TPA: Hsp20/alpha crystallin family protein [Ignavibacteriaceae bacterium]|nr:Hsp20/alpha crystallin family protein [Ignavibacteriaceae bacterium]
MAIVRWDPSRDLLNIEREFNRMFQSFNNRFGFGDSDNDVMEYENAMWTPLTDISEDDNNFTLKLDLPGVKKEDVKINYENGQLSISGERKQEHEKKNSKYHRVERSYGRYFRSFNLPSKIQEDKIDAEFKDGQLTITVPKSEDAKPKQIEVKIK